MKREQALENGRWLAQSIIAAIPNAREAELYRSGFIDGYMYYYDLINKPPTMIDNSHLEIFKAEHIKATKDFMDKMGKALSHPDFETKSDIRNG